MQRLQELYTQAKESGFIHAKKKGWNWLKNKAEWLGFLDRRRPQEVIQPPVIVERPSLGYRIGLFIPGEEDGELDLSNDDITEVLDFLSYVEYDRDNFLYYINFGAETYTLSDNYINKLNEVVGPRNFQYGSDPEAIIDRYERVIITKVRRQGVRNMPTHGFLPVSLTEYVKRSDHQDFKVLRELWERYVPSPSLELGESHDDCVGNCIAIAEREEKIPVGCHSKYAAYRANNSSTYDIRQKDMKHIAEAMGICIIMTNYADEECKSVKTVYNSTAEVKLELYSLKNHAFLDERTKFTVWSITDGYSEENVEEIATLRGERHIYSTLMREKRGKKCLLSETVPRNLMMSINFVKNMIKNPLLTQEMSTVDRILSQPKGYNTVIDHNCDLSAATREDLPEKNGVKKGNNPFCTYKCAHNKCGYDDRIYADFETYQDSDRRHVQDMLVTEYKGVQRTYLANLYQTPTKQFLNDINSGKYGPYGNHFIVFHNLGYDMNFIAQEPEIRIQSRLQPSASKTKCALASYYNHRLYFKDSYSVITMPLAVFPKIFGFKSEKKGACPYEYYDAKTVKEEYANIQEASVFVSDDKKEDFLESVKGYLNPSNPLQFAHNKHRLDYCKQDVNLLRRGYEEFRKWIVDLFDEELDYCVSLPQVAFNNVNNKGCLDGVAPISGVQQLYLANFVFGGRCMTARNEKHIAEGIVPLDFNSLYPSAMARDDFVVPKGNGRQLNASETGNNFDLTKYAVAFLSIKVLSVPKHRDFPLIPSKISGFTNTPGKDEVVFVSKITLEDIIKYHSTKKRAFKYTVLGGVVWDEGCGINTGMKKEMEGLYNLRVKHKAEGKKSEVIIKLIMNSTYGRFIMKPIEEKEVFFNCYREGEYKHSAYKTYMERHYNHIISIEEGPHVAIITRAKSVLEHQNYVQIGISILDMSKRLMNEMMCLAEDMVPKATIFYQDTDSTHMYAKDIPRLAALYEKTYGRTMIKDGVLQKFSSDFDAPDGYRDPIASLAIYAGKKSYLEIVECTNKEDASLDKHIYDHVRMKGVPKKAIDAKCKELNISVKELYLRLYTEESITFDLLADNGCSFDFKGFQVYSLPKFTREVQFLGRPTPMRARIIYED